MESTDTTHSMSPAASAFAWAARSIRSNVPSAAHLRKRVCSVAHGPYRSGTSRQAVPVRNFRHDPVQDPAVIEPLASPQRLGQQRPDELPLGVRQFMATYHDTMIHQR